MLIYWLNLLIILIWPLIFKIVGIKNKRVQLLILFLQLYLLLALRSPLVGADVNGYLSAFEKIKHFPLFEFDIVRFEPGYIFLNNLLSFIDNNQVFIAVIAFIPLSMIFWFILKESRIYWLSVFLFVTLGFYTSLFSSFRQSIAMGLILISYHYIKKEKHIIFIVLVLIASLFHVSALAFLSVFFVRKFPVNFKTIIFYSFAALLILILSEPIIKISTNLVGTIEYDIESNGGVGYLFLLLFVILIGLYFKNGVLKKYPEDKIMYHILFLAFIFQLLALDFSLMTRVTRYFSILLIIFIPNVIASIRDKKLIIIGIYLICILSTFMYYKELNEDLTSIVPYHYFTNN